MRAARAMRSSPPRRDYRVPAGALRCHAMRTRRSLWVSGGAGLCCLGLGALLGSWCAHAGERAVVAAEPLRLAVVPSFTDVVERIGAGVVGVSAVRETAALGDGIAVSAPGDGQSRPALRSGSGFVVSPRGMVVTSRHVVYGAMYVEVTVPGRLPLRAELVGEDAATDLALLRLPDAPPDLQALPLAVDDTLRVGDWIVAVGSPLGYAQTVTAGIVSFVGRHLRHNDFAVTNDFLQISAPVNPGNSGCPVFDLQGRVVGVTTQAPAEAQGISFAVPARTVAWAVAAMERAADGRVRRGYLGIEFASCVEADGKRSPCGGARVMQVMEGQPAQRAGLRAGDVVVRIDGRDLPDARTLHDHILGSPPGTPLALQVWRDGRPERVDSLVAVLGELGARPDSPRN